MTREQDDRVGHVLDSIDHALADWDVSDDAMRWTPEPAPRDETPARRPPVIEGHRMYVAPVHTPPLGDGWTEVGWIDAEDAGRFARTQMSLRVRPAPRVDLDAVRASLQNMRIESSIGPFHPADMAALNRSLSNAVVAWRDGIEEFARTAVGAFAAIQRLAERIAPEPEPDDPRERALWLRQHRNTGPQAEPFARARRGRDRPPPPTRH